MKKEYFYVKALTNEVLKFLEEKYYDTYNDYFYLTIDEIAEIVRYLDISVDSFEVFKDEQLNDQIDTNIIEQLISKVSPPISNLEELDDDKYYAVFPCNDVLEDEIAEDYKQSFDANNGVIVVSGEELKDLLKDFQIKPIEIVVFESEKDEYDEDALGKEIFFTDGLY